MYTPTIVRRIVDQAPYIDNLVNEYLTNTNRSSETAALAQLNQVSGGQFETGREYRIQPEADGPWTTATLAAVITDQDANPTPDPGHVWGLWKAADPADQFTWRVLTAAQFAAGSVRAAE